MLFNFQIKGDTVRIYCDLNYAKWLVRTCRVVRGVWHDELSEVHL